MLEILLLGCGRFIEPVDPEVRHFMRSMGIKLEAVDSVLLSWIFSINCYSLSDMLAYCDDTFWDDIPVHKLDNNKV